MALAQKSIPNADKPQNIDPPAAEKAGKFKAHMKDEGFTLVIAGGKDSQELCLKAVELAHLLDRRYDPSDWEASAEWMRSGSNSTLVLTDYQIAFRPSPSGQSAELVIEAIKQDPDTKQALNKIYFSING